MQSSDDLAELENSGLFYLFFFFLLPLFYFIRRWFSYDYFLIVPQVENQFTLRRLFVWIQEPLQRLQTIAMLTDVAKGNWLLLSI